MYHGMNVCAFAYFFASTTAILFIECLYIVLMYIFLTSGLNGILDCLGFHIMILNAYKLNKIANKVKNETKLHNTLVNK